MSNTNQQPFNGNFIGADGEVRNISEFLGIGGVEPSPSPSTEIQYSLAEQETNMRWLDGQRIYQQTLTGTLGLSNTFIDIPLPSGVNTVIRIDAFAQGNTYRFSVPNIGESSAGASDAIEYNIALSVQRDTNMLRVRNYSNRNNYSFFATVFYTKVV